MANCRFPGPVGFATNQVSVDAGTNCLAESPKEGVVGMEWRATPKPDSVIDSIIEELSKLGAWSLEFWDALELLFWWALGSPTGDWEFGPEDRQTANMQKTRAFQEAIAVYQAWNRDGRPYGKFEYDGIPCEWVQSKDAFYVKGRTSGYTTGSTMSETLKNPLWAFTGTFSIRFRVADGFGADTVYVELENFTSLPSYLHGIDSINPLIEKYLYTKVRGFGLLTRSGQHYRFLMRIPLESTGNSK
jgi:hypothetical protein